MKNKKGKTVAKENLPSKVCVVCNRPFTWRKKWERVWDEVTTCSKSCNAKRKVTTKQQQSQFESSQPSSPHQQQQPCCETKDRVVSDDSSITSLSSTEQPHLTEKQALRKQRKEAVKAQKRERKLKRMGQAPKDVGRKACDLCSTRVDLLIRCTVDETQTFKMVCGKCWQGVSGGMVDGNSSTHPHYRYGGLWKNRSADLKKKVGNGSNKNYKTDTSASSSTSGVLQEIEKSLLIDDGDVEKEDNFYA